MLQLDRLEDTKCLTESVDLYLDASISQYGVGAKNGTRHPELGSKMAVPSMAA